MRAEFHAGDVCDLKMVPDASVDLVFSSNLLEHLPSKEAAERMMTESRRVLKPGGSLLLLGPNLRYLPGEYWDSWDHRLPITDRSLAELLGSLGFKVVEQHARFLPYTTKSALPHRLIAPAHLVGGRLSYAAEQGELDGLTD